MKNKVLNRKVLDEKNRVGYLCLGIKYDIDGSFMTLTNLILVRIDWKTRKCLDTGKSAEELLVNCEMLDGHGIDYCYQGIPIMNYGILNLMKHCVCEWISDTIDIKFQKGNKLDHGFNRKCAYSVYDKNCYYEYYGYMVEFEPDTMMGHALGIDYRGIVVEVFDKVKPNHNERLINPNYMRVKCQGVGPAFLGYEEYNEMGLHNFQNGITVDDRMTYRFDPIWYLQENKINFYSATGLDFKNDMVLEYYFFDASDSKIESNELIRVIGRFYKDTEYGRYTANDGIQYVLIEYIPTGVRFAVDEPDFSAILEGERKDELIICLYRWWEYDELSAKLYISRDGISFQTAQDNISDNYRRRRLRDKKNGIKMV